MTARSDANAGQKPRQTPRKRPNFLLRRVVALSVAALLGYGLFSLSRGAVQAAKTLLFPPPEKYDVIVWGGTPSGVVAALSSARHGAKTLLLEPKEFLGGDITYAHLNQFDVPLSDRHTLESPVAYGIFGEYFRKFGVAFDVHGPQKTFEADLQKAGVRVEKGVTLEQLYVRGKRLHSLTFSRSRERFSRMQGEIFIDADNDATLAARAGASYSVGRETSNPDRKMQSAGLLFSVKNVDWKQLSDYVKSTKIVPRRRFLRLNPHGKTATDVRIKGRRAIIRMGGINEDYAWERGEIVKDYQPKGPNMLAMSINFGRQNDGSVILNTLNILNVDGLNEASKARAYAEAKKEIPHFIAHLRKTLPGFQNGVLGEVAPALYIRETRHISGFTTLQARDIQTSRRFPDRVALASYNIDLHPYSRKDGHFGNKRYLYSIPLSALVPRTANGIFVASRSLSATYTAAGSARVIPITMAMGEAAGVAAWQCATRDYSPHDLVKSPGAIANLQKELRRVGMEIGDDLGKS